MRAIKFDASREMVSSELGLRGKESRNSNEARSYSDPSLNGHVNGLNGRYGSSPDALDAFAGALWAERHFTNHCTPRTSVKWRRGKLPCQPNHRRIVEMSPSLPHFLCATRMNGMGSLSQLIRVSRCAAYGPTATLARCMLWQCSV